MDKNIVDVLKLLAKKINATGARWMIFGSCGLALNGMQIHPDDFDILTDEDGILKINRALKNYEIDPIRNAPSEIFDSLMNNFLINNFRIEVMSNFKVKSRIDNQWHDVSHLLKNPIFIDLDNFKIPALPLLQSIELYKLMGRDKDIVKIQKIEEFIKEKLT